MASTILYEDRWGEVIHREDLDTLEIRWFDTTSALSKDEFEGWLSGYARAVEEKQPAGALVDALSFRMDPSLNDMEWRDANIVPRYNAAGLKKFAFVMPGGVPMIGDDPAPEGPADYPTGYFGTREDAVAWLRLLI